LSYAAHEARVSSTKGTLALIGGLAQCPGLIQGFGSELDIQPDAGPASARHGNRGAPAIE
jgi:hypothetical protein